MKGNIKKCFSNLGFSAKLLISASKKYFFLNILASIISAILPYLPLLVWRDLLNSLATYTSAGEILDVIILLTALYCGVLLLKRVFDLFSQFISYKYSDSVNYYIDNYIVDKVSTVELAFYDSGTLNNTLRNVSSRIEPSTNLMIKTVFEFISGIVQFVIALTMISTLNLWMLPIIVLLSIPSIMQSKYSQKNGYEFDKTHSVTERRLEYYKGLFFGSCRQEIRLYHAKDYFTDKYRKDWKEWKTAKIRLSATNQITWILQYIMLTVIELIAYVFAMARLVKGKIGIGDVTYYVSVANEVRGSFVNVFYLAVSFLQSADEVEDIRTFMQMKPTLETSGSKIPSMHPRIEFRNVSFRYPSAETDVLKNCSFVIESGETLGLVGLNGAGKSTIIKLLCRFYDPTDGQVLIDGIDAREYDIVKLREMFGVLFQDYVRYSFSLRENVAMSNIERVNEDEAITLACDQSKAAEFIAPWGRGIDEQLTRQFDPDGKELSGGQWQRVSLARAFFRDAPVVLLDEPSAALDAVAEHEIFESFAAISEDKSAVLISHRLSSITLADKILVLSDGSIIEQGSHAELLRQNGEYARLFHLQARKYAQ